MKGRNWVASQNSGNQGSHHRVSTAGGLLEVGVTVILTDLDRSGRPVDFGNRRDLKCMVVPRWDFAWVVSVGIDRGYGTNRQNNVWARLPPGMRIGFDCRN